MYYVYLLASRRHGTLYCGVTNALLRRVYEHKSAQVSGFTKKYHVHRLVWWEAHQDIGEAIAREKRIKRWRRDWKLALIEQDNPDWDDLYPGLGGTDPSEIAGEGIRRSDY
ncbi:GIY-YIG nuclease family protein [Maricaulis sp.]|uniref:GIY-YIG nuclease family protein n=1 Tax=Maricaulis sp. TaxID=1486257 RepID=UPI0025BAD775|nr:GIY-YIG nuclease family protein [Maricaulis sp.]